MRILVVDDEEDILGTTVAVLQMLGHDAFPESDWREVCPRLQQETFDVVLQDMRMPGLSFVDHVRNIRKASSARIVLFTANRVADSDAAAMDVDGFLPKPFDVEALTASLASAGHGVSRPPRPKSVNRTV